MNTVIKQIFDSDCILVMCFSAVFVLVVTLGYTGANTPPEESLPLQHVGSSALRDSQTAERCSLCAVNCLCEICLCPE